ncbi:thioredoxin domain-containing protein 11 isoform X2 [Agrilus planipennis]|uniref:Thioredoxin domain-containing protein 11 isoform X2 n=1 Tax=Agrilus planipennis TaxID=224129 RepID=A0A1W4WSY8_AGRPL|nr:thioredoxin domain-containing protein 11 isoform X2 [Agrilus planipennis]
MGILCLLKYVVCGQVGMSDSCLESNQELKYLKVHSDNDAAEGKGADTDFEQSISLERNLQKKDKQTTLHKWAFKMLHIIKELAIMLLAVVTYAALTNNSPKISKSPSAFPFFPKDSLVIDYYKGELVSANERAHNADFSFVMFYAPWSAECRKTRDEFEIVAKHFHKHVEMSAVNCWQPGSECRRQYSKVYNWPVLIAYPTVGKGIQYKGPKAAPYMMRFLMQLMQPFVRVTTTEEIVQLMATHDALVLGSVNALPGSRDFAVLYSTILRYASQDVTQNMAFAVLTIPAKDQNGNPYKPSIFLYMWNETLKYPDESPWTPDSILNWITDTFQVNTMWLVPPKIKTNTLSFTLENSPSLFLFTPRNPMKQSNDFYNLLHEVALEYNNCKSPRMEMLKENVAIGRLEDYFSHKLLLQKCAIKKEAQITSAITFLQQPKWLNSTGMKVYMRAEESCSKCDNIKSDLSLLCQIINENSCSRKTNECIEQGNLGEEFVKKYETSMLKDENDPLAPRNLRKFWNREMCRLLRITEKLIPSIYTDYVKNNLTVNNKIDGLLCKTNRTLTFYALDSLETYYFAERLGVNVFDRKDKTAAVIIDDNSETHYVLNEPVNDVTLRDFIVSYADNTLPRSRKSITSIKSNNTHSYQIKTFCDKQKEVCVKELDSDSFLPTIAQRDKAVVVMYHSKQCSFCNGISYIFLIVAKILAPLEIVEFARIDGDINILPWEYTMNSFPTIIYFPDKMKSESRTFPCNVLPVTVPNLLAFLLSNFNPRLKLHTMWILCNQTRFEDERNSCISSVRSENLSLINHTLKEWRKADARQRAELMYRLQQMRNLHLLLAHSPQRTEDIKVYLKRLNSQAFNSKYNSLFDQKEKITKDY